MMSRVLEGFVHHGTHEAGTVCETLLVDLLVDTSHFQSKCEL